MYTVACAPATRASSITADAAAFIVVVPCADGAVGGWQEGKWALLLPHLIMRS